MSHFRGQKRATQSSVWMRCAPLAMTMTLVGWNLSASGQDVPPTTSRPNSVDPVSYQQESAAGTLGNVILKALSPAETSSPAKDPPVIVPISGTNDLPNVKIEGENGLVSLVVRDAPLYQVLSLVAQTQNLNVVSAESIDAKVSVTLHDVPLDEALTAILSIAGYTWSLHNNVIHVSSIGDARNLPPTAQGRRIKVFRLDYAAADAVAAAVQGFLSPAGKVFFHQSANNNFLKTKEFVVVEDMPQFLGPVSDYIAQIDQPPRQVMIETYILEVDLDSTTRHGINFEHMFDVAGNAITLETAGFANPAASPAFLATIAGGNLTALLEQLQTTNDVKTLASPKLLVLNGQTAHLQVGEQLGFRVTTTTETSSLESVDFLNVGVVLTLTPRISRDNRIMLHIKPEVSSGQVSADTGLPEEETTEVETDVLLNDGQGMVIGGLIQEKDSTIQSKIPYLGDVWMVGKLFQRSEIVRKRSEIIIAIVPRVVPYTPHVDQLHETEVARATTPLLQHGLERLDRPWEPVLYEALRNPRPIRLPPILPPERDIEHEVGHE